MPLRHDPPVVTTSSPAGTHLSQISNPPSDHKPSRALDESIQTHLLTMLSVSAGMVGVCLTAIGLLGIAKTLTQLETICDDILAANSLIYLIVAGLSFVGLRTPLKRHANQVALAVDTTFCIALMLTVLASVILVFVF